MSGGGHDVFLLLGWFELRCLDLFYPRWQGRSGVGPTEPNLRIFPLKLLLISRVLFFRFDVTSTHSK